MPLFGLSLLAFIFILIPWPAGTLQTVFGLIFITVQSQLLGWKFFRYKQPWFRWLLGFLLLLTLIIIVGTVFFYWHNLSPISLYLLSLSIPAVLLIPTSKPHHIESETRQPRLTIKQYLFSALLILLYLILIYLIINLLITHQTREAIQSPWLVVPKSIFVYYFLTTLVIITLHIGSARYRALIYSIHFFLSFGVTLFVYPLGFGFDPFIHQATEQIIATTGTLSPKPYYYIGHYSLVVWLSHWLGLSLRYIDSWLVPMLAAISLPTIIFQAFKENFHNQSKATQLLPLIFLAIPFGALIQSTPQALSVLLSLIIIFLALFYINRQGVGLAYILMISLATLAIHPLSGIPVVFFAILLGLYHRFWHRQGLSKYVRIIGYSSLTALAAIILPVTFFLNSYLSRATTGTISTTSTEEANTTPELWANTYQAFVRFEDLIYLLGNNTRLIIILVSTISLLFMIKKKRLHYFLHYLITFFVLVVNYILLKAFVSFDFLIPYERFIFPERILQLSFYFLLPFVCVTGYLILRRIVQLTPLLQSICWLLLAGSMTISWYLSYPRFDYQEQNKGFSLSQYDLETVRWIHQQENDKTYVVLANQSVSAAAINQYGFYHYYGRTFYYPIPTGGPLYQSYLDLIHNRQEVNLVLQEIKKLTGAKTAYLVVNDYWSGFEDIAARNKKTADQTQLIGPEKTYIFKYQLP